jgi:hypothetical protein
MHAIISDELGRIWTKKTVVCVQVPQGHLPGRPDKIHDRSISKLIFTFLKGGVSIMFVRKCIMMHKYNIKVTG